MRLGLGAAAALLALTSVTAAGAAQRYASPAGSGSECTAGAPCSLHDAITFAAPKDEVIVRTGTYDLGPEAETIYAFEELTVHGDPSGPMPRIVGSKKSTSVLGVVGSRLEYLEVVSSGESASAILCVDGGEIDRVRAFASGGEFPYAFVGSSSIGKGCSARDSLLVAAGKKAGAMAVSALEKSATFVARNVTAVAAGAEADAFASFYGGLEKGTTLLDLKNSIAIGGRYDLLATDTGAGHKGNIEVSSSSFDLAHEGEISRVFDKGGNQTAAPLFVDAAGGDYREAFGSPTIDAGVADQLGALELGGGPRVQGAAPDIGAYEFAPVEVRSLTLSSKAFRAANLGGATLSRKKGRRAPVGTNVSFELSSGPAPVQFGLERAVTGRRAGGKCVPVRLKNRKHKHCTLFKPIKGGFTITGAAGANLFTFTGRIDGKGLKPGRYKLVASVLGSSRKAGFKIVH